MPMVATFVVVLCLLFIVQLANRTELDLLPQ